MMKKLIGVQNYFDQWAGLKIEVKLTGGKILTLRLDSDFDNFQRTGKRLDSESCQDSLSCWKQKK